MINRFCQNLRFISGQNRQTVSNMQFVDKPPAERGLVLGNLNQFEFQHRTHRCTWLLNGSCFVEIILQSLKISR